MTTDSRVLDRYGPAGFVAALINILVLGLVAGVVGVYIVFMGPPVLIVDAAVGFGLSRTRGQAAQVGRGMLIGCVAVLVTILGAAAVLVVGNALH